MVQEFLGLAVGEHLVDVVTSEVAGVTILVELIDDPYFLVNLSDVFGATVNRDFDIDIIFHYEITVVGQFYQLFVETVHDLLHDDY